jgi:hypothetical protein
LCSSFASDSCKSCRLLSVDSCCDFIGIVGECPYSIQILVYCQCDNRLYGAKIQLLPLWGETTNGEWVGDGE